MEELTSKQRAQLRGLANSIDTDWRCCEAEITV